MMGDGSKSIEGSKAGANGIGIGVEAGIGGGAPFGGEPEYSVSVTK